MTDVDVELLVQKLMHGAKSRNELFDDACLERIVGEYRIVAKAGASSRRLQSVVHANGESQSLTLVLAGLLSG